jgi:hypothetical protein
VFLGVNFVVLYFVHSLPGLEFAMQLKSLLTAAVVASTLLLDVASAANFGKFGRFGQKARDRLDRKKNAGAAANTVERRSTEHFRFLNKNTQRELLYICHI